LSATDRRSGPTHALAFASEIGTGFSPYIKTHQKSGFSRRDTLFSSDRTTKHAVRAHHCQTPHNRDRTTQHLAAPPVRRRCLSGCHSRREPAFAFSTRTNFLFPSRG